MMMSVTLNNPLTEEDWDKIYDVDMDNTNSVTFYTKHGKEVEFVKVVRCKDCDSAECSGVMIYCLTHGCYMRDNDFCSYGKREDGEQDE